MYELTVPDILAIAKYRIDGKIDRGIVMRALRMKDSSIRVFYAPYYDMWKPEPHKRRSRVEYISTLPKIIRNIIMVEHRNVLNDEREWKRHHLHREYIREMKNNE